MLFLILAEEFFDLVDGYRLIESSSGAAVLAAAVADSSADCRERVVLADQSHGVGVFAFACHLDISLYRYVSRAGCLTRRCS